MKVILQQDVSGKGKAGQLVEVSPGYARNYLFPRKLAVEATVDNVNAMKLREKAHKAQIEREKAEAAEIGRKLNGSKVRVVAKGGESGRLFGSVTTKEIADALAEQYGVSVEKNKLVAEPIKAFGTYEVKCKLGYDVTSTVIVEVCAD